MSKLYNAAIGTFLIRLVQSAGDDHRALEYHVLIAVGIRKHLN